MHNDRLTMISLAAILIGVTSAELVLVGARRVSLGVVRSLALLGA